MVRTPRWIETEKPHGILHVKISSWKYFDDYIRDEMLDYRVYVWRGQRNSDWLLEPTLDRFLKTKPKTKRELIAKSHLRNFKYATRGRRGSNPPHLSDDNDWWALGQHHGLATPLLDWTLSPFAAAYFSYIGTGKPQTAQRAIYGFSQNIQYNEKEKEDETIKFIRPMSDENPRLVNQGGIFTRSPIGVDIESWLEQYIPEDYNQIILIKIIIPNKDRLLALRSLNRMNINHSSLFPDLFGSSKFCNTDLEIDKY